jgi:tripartite-type tricarboxylate transporter receptor subunit TctC
MRFSRRRFMTLTGGFAALPSFSHLASAQTYPTRPVRIIVGYGPGGVADILARLVGQALSERLGQPFIVENRPGAATNLATEAVVRAPADGYTLLLVNLTNAINATLYQDLRFDFAADISPVAGIAQAPLVMEVNPLVPAKTVPEFIAYAKANSGKVTVAHSGVGSPPHIAEELFKIMTGVQLNAIPYSAGSAPVLTDLMAGRIDVTFDPLLTSIEYIRSEKLRALAVTTATRAEMLPNVPTVAEFIPGYEANTWVGIGAPKNTPTEIIDRLNKEINAALADPHMKSRLADLGGSTFATSAAEFRTFIAKDTDKWANVIRTAGIKLN